MLRLGLLALLTTLAMAAETQIGYRDCKSAMKITEVTATECILKQTDGKKKYCEFKKGTNPMLKVKFTATEEVPNTLKTEVKAKIGQTMLDFPLNEPATCGFIKKVGGSGCPLTKGNDYTYEQGINIAENYPVGELTQVNWNIGYGDKKVLCIIFQAKIIE